MSKLTQVTVWTHSSVYVHFWRGLIKLPHLKMGFSKLYKQFIRIQTAKGSSGTHDSLKILNWCNRIHFLLQIRCVCSQNNLRPCTEVTDDHNLSMRAELRLQIQILVPCSHVKASNIPSVKITRQRNSGHLPVRSGWAESPTGHQRTPEIINQIRDWPNSFTKALDLFKVFKII